MSTVSAFSCINLIIPACGHSCGWMDDQISIVMRKGPERVDNMGGIPVHLSCCDSKTSSNPVLKSLDDASFKIKL